MLQQYLEHGGVEIANNARAYDYARGVPACADFLKLAGASGLHDMASPWVPPVLDGGGAIITPGYSDAPAYSYINISNAPWYDPNLEESAQFLGNYIIKITGLTDSTMTAEVTEGLDDGGVVGPQRHAARRFTVRSVLLASSNKALEYGLSWLNSALGNQFCGKHGTACGTADVMWFDDAARKSEASDLDYTGDLVDPLKRFLHDTSCTTGAFVTDQFQTPRGGYYYIVEYTFTAETPFVYGILEPIASAGTALTVYSDIPYNLLTYPSAEVSDGVPQLISTNYLYNGSAEYTAATWAAEYTGDITGGEVSSGVTTEISAVGPSSFRAVMTAAGAGTGDLSASIENAISLTAGLKVSATAWVRVAAEVGTPTLGPFVVEVVWLNGATVEGTELLGTVDPGDYDGATILKKGFVVPADTTSVKLRARATLNYVMSDEVRLYVDAAALTRP